MTVAAATVRPIVQQQSREQAQAQLAQVCAFLPPRFPRAVDLLDEEILAFYEFPAEQSHQIYPTSPWSGSGRELSCYSAVASIFPDRQSVIGLLGALLAGQ